MNYRYYRSRCDHSMGRSSSFILFSSEPKFLFISVHLSEAPSRKLLLFRIRQVHSTFIFIFIVFVQPRSIH